MTSSPYPRLSVVVAIVSDTTERATAAHLHGCLAALSAQVDAPAMEVIVPHLTAVEGLDRVRARFPNVTFLPVADVTARLLAVAGLGDGIAPIAACHHIADLVPNVASVDLETAPGGHLGVLTGRAARGTTWILLDRHLDR